VPARFDRRQSPGHLVNHLARLFAQALYGRIRRYGVLPGQFPVLLCLWEQEGLTQTELARRLDIEQPTMANTLKRMERGGLVRRGPDPADRRRAHTYLTTRAKALRGPLTKHARAVNELALAGLRATDRRSLLAVARRMMDNLTQDAAAAGQSPSEPTNRRTSR